MAPPNDIDENDRRLFRDAVAEVRPLENDRIDPVDKRPPPRPQQTRLDEKRVLDDLLGEHPESGELETGEELWFARPGVQHRTLRKLRQGQFSVAAELDLHGMTVEQARQVLGRFLNWASTQPSRCVRIIHGKGRRSPKGPVLKHKVYRWLRQRDEVLAVCSARRQHGGTGAVYVLLKNR